MLFHQGFYYRNLSVGIVHLWTLSCSTVSRSPAIIGMLCFPSRLFVVRGKPQDVLPQLFKKWGVSRMTYEYDTEPYSRSRDLKVSELAKAHSVEVVYKISHTLHDIDRSVTHWTASQCLVQRCSVSGPDLWNSSTERLTRCLNLKPANKAFWLHL